MVFYDIYYPKKVNSEKEEMSRYARFRDKAKAIDLAIRMKSDPFNYPGMVKVYRVETTEIQF